MAGFIHPLADEQRKAIHRMLAEHVPKSEIARTLGIHRNTVMNEGRRTSEHPAAVRRGEDPRPFAAAIAERLSPADRDVFEAIGGGGPLDAELRVLRLEILRLLGLVHREVVVLTAQGVETLAVEVDEVEKAQAIARVIEGICKIHQGGHKP